MTAPDSSLVGAPDPSDSPADPPLRPRQESSGGSRSLLIWVGGAIATVVVFFGVVVALNSTVYSASGFVTRYLDALDRGDLASLLDINGVSVPDGADDGALTRSALVAVDEATVTRESDSADGGRTVEVAWRDGAATGTMEFTVAPAGALGGVFSDWRFTDSPITSVAVAALHAPGVRVNNVPLVAGAPDEAATDRVIVPVAAFMPSRLTVDYETRNLAAAPVTAIAGADNASALTIDAQATADFVETVQTELDDFLDSCATQQVLQPSGCPFGTFVEDRLLAPPTWSIAAYPAVTITPGASVGQWLVPATPGTAHIVADVLSLFDGSQTRLDEDVAFTVDYRIEIDGGGSLQIVGDQ